MAATEALPGHLMPRPETPPPPDDDRVPLFGTWRAIHAAVIACALLVMGLLAVFSRWPF
jgi:hypothetical protein